MIRRSVCALRTMFLRRVECVAHIAFFGLLCVAEPALAQSAAERLEGFFSAVRTLDAKFTQRVFGEDGQLVQESSGSVQLMRPGRFRWEYEKPDVQLILADGKQLWIFDPELEQATVKPIEDALGAAPIVLLTGDRPLQEQFVVERAAPRDGLEWVELIPKVQDMEFNRIKLGLDEGGIAQMVLHDQFGQTTVIRLQDVRTNIDIDRATFQFEPPKGTDVIDATR
jgi:outer membrane lipoprotein carrier protein